MNTNHQKQNLANDPTGKEVHLKVKSFLIFKAFIPAMFSFLLILGFGKVQGQHMLLPLPGTSTSEVKRSLQPIKYLEKEETEEQLLLTGAGLGAKYRFAAEQLEEVTLTRTYDSPERAAIGLEVTLYEMRKEGAEIILVQSEKKHDTGYYMAIKANSICDISWVQNKQGEVILEVHDLIRVPTNVHPDENSIYFAHIR